MGSHRYASGELVQLGDVVEYAGHRAVIELVVDDPAVDSDGSWLLRTHGPVVMLREPAVFGRAYLATVHDEEDLVFVGRRDEAGALG